MRSRFLAVVLLPVCGWAQGPMCERIKALTADPKVAAAHWGVSVTTLDGAAVCGVNEAQLFRPASNNKIFTTATALAMLGPVATVATTVRGMFDPATGVVTGDLRLVGAGDANLDSGDLPYLPAAQRPKVPVPFAFHDLEDLAAQLVAKGVKTVTGDVVGDDTYFPYEPYAPSWNGDDFVWGYGAPVSALTIADNQLKLTITPGTGGEQAAVDLEQHGVAYFTVQAQVQMVLAKSKDAGVQVERLPGSRTIRVYGTMAADAPPEVEELAIDDPAAYAAMAFRSMLLAHGITVAGTTRARHNLVRDGRGFTAQVLMPGSPEEAMANGNLSVNCLAHIDPAPVLATHTSAALANDVLLTNKVSQNLHAELLLHRLGRVWPCGEGSNVQGARLIRSYMIRAGVEKNDYMLYDGSGLSDHDVVAPRALTKFLGYAAGQPWFATFKASLPDAGVDGTLASRFKPPLAYKVSAKTGTLGESRALSGYVTTVAGQTLIFSILVDTHLPTTAADRTVMDKIVETIATVP